MGDIQKGKIFISGPMRGYERHNRAAFNRWERLLGEAGQWDPVNPVKVGDAVAKPDDVDNDPELLKKVLDADIEALSGCTAMFLLNGWENSEGSRKEMEYALAHGMKIIHEHDYLDRSRDVDLMVSRLERFTNSLGVRNRLVEMAEKMTCLHRTLVQSFTGGFVIPFVRSLAKKYRVGYTDGRDAAAGEACVAMCEALESKYGIKEDDDFAFPIV